MPPTTDTAPNPRPRRRTAPSKRSRRPEPAVTEPGPLAPSAAALAAVDALLHATPDLPEVAAWQVTPAGISGSPYLLAMPVTALRTWTRALAGIGARVTVTTRTPPGGWGTELVARTRLGGHAVELTVVTWREVEPNGTGVVSAVRLDRAVAEEARGLGQPLDPARTGPAVPIESDAELTVPPHGVVLAPLPSVFA